MVRIFLSKRKLLSLMCPTDLCAAGINSLGKALCGGVAGLLYSQHKSFPGVS